MSVHPEEGVGSPRTALWMVANDSVDLGTEP